MLEELSSFLYIIYILLLILLIVIIIIKILYIELIELLKDDDFIEGYLDSVKVSLEVKLKTYTLERKKLLIQLETFGGSNSLSSLGNKDTHLEKLIIHEKAIGDIIEIIK